jgi:hypothetical protein
MVASVATAMTRPTMKTPAHMRLSMTRSVSFRGGRLITSSVSASTPTAKAGVESVSNLWDVRRPAQVLWVELRPGSPYRHIILQLADPRATAEGLSSAMAAFTPTDSA